MIKLLIALLAFWNPHIERCADEFNVPAQAIRGIMWIESYGDPSVTSYAGAHGLMQIMPGTAEYIEAMTGMSAEVILSDPYANIRGGTWLFSLWYHRFGGLDMALASYNAGAGDVIECDCVPEYTKYYVRKARAAMGWDWPDKVCNGLACLVRED